MNSLYAHLLAYALTELCPKVLIVESWGDERGFYVDAIFPKPFSKEMLPDITHRMREHMDEEPRLLEMMTSNAASCLADQGQYILSDRVKRSDKQLTSLIKWGEFFDLACLSEIPSEFKENPLKLVGVVNAHPYTFRRKEERVLRICGNAFFEEPKSDLYFRMPSGLLRSFDERHFYWTGAGYAAREKLKRWHEELLRSKGYEVVQVPDREVFFEKTGQRRFAEWKEVRGGGEHSGELYDPARRVRDRLSLYCEKENLEKELISLLKFIDEASKMLGLEFKAYLTGSQDKELAQALKAVGMAFECELSAVHRVELRAKDCFGKEWLGPHVELIERLGGFLIDHSLFHSLERQIAWQLEFKGSLL